MPDPVAPNSDILWVRPRDVELDLFGLTHIGRVRKENQDHFMLCTVHQQVVVHGTSLPNPEALPLRGERLATYMLVADGVGSGAGGGEASRLALATITHYVTASMRSYHEAGSAADADFHQALTGAARWMTTIARQWDERLSAIAALAEELPCAESGRPE